MLDVWRGVRITIGPRALGALLLVSAAAGWRGYEWALEQWAELKGASDLLTLRVNGAATDWQTELAFVNLRLSVLESQLRAAGHEHVRYVVAVRRGDVKKALDDYDALVVHWPCAPADANCDSPARATEIVLGRHDL